MSTTDLAYKPYDALATTDDTNGALAPVSHDAYAPQPAYGYAPQTPHLHANVLIQNQQPAMPTINFVAANHAPNFVIRALWFLFIGWWLSAATFTLAYLMIISIVLMPVGFMLVNRIPQLLTLRPRTRTFTTTHENGTLTFTEGRIKQRSMLVRIPYTLLCGLWVGILWGYLGLMLCMTLLGMPIGILMLDRLPVITTLRRN